MSEVNITVEDIMSETPEKEVKLISVVGQLDESNVDEKAQEVYAVLDGIQTKPILIFDFDGLEYMNSKSIGYLSDWYAKAQSKGGDLVIIKAKPNILDILQVVGLTQLINCYKTLEEAKAALA